MKNGVSSCLLLFYKACFFFVPIPLFYDFGGGGWLFILLEDYNRIFDSPSIPMPIGAMALLIGLFIGFVVKIFSPSYMSTVLPPLKLSIFLCYFLLFFGCYALFVSGLSPARLVQVVLPAVILSFLSFPRRHNDRFDVLRLYILGAGGWFFLHFLSIVLSAEEFISPHYREDFTHFYGYLVYQSLVSYPGVVALVLYLIAWAVFEHVAKAGNVRKYWFLLWCFSLLFALMYIGFASGRRAFVVEVFAGLLIILLAFFYYGIRFQYAKKTRLLISVLFFLFLVFCLAFYFNTDLSYRVMSSVEQGTFDSGRINILGRAVDFFYQNPLVLLFGAGGSDAPGFHNFFLDQMHRVGALGLVFIYSVTYYLIRSAYKALRNENKLGYMKSVLLAMIFSSFFLQSMINASVSQPYYLVNIVVVLMLVVFSLPYKLASSSKRNA